jgi:hypothetical protein
MAFLAQCAPERIPRTLVEGAIPDEVDRAAALLALSEVSLLRNDPFEDGTPAVAVHRLVQAVARARAGARDCAASAAERIGLRLKAIYPRNGNDNPASWPLCAQLTTHLLTWCKLVAVSGAGTEEQAALLTSAGGYFYGRAAYDRARPLFERALAISEEALGPENSATAASLDRFGYEQFSGIVIG